MEELQQEFLAETAFFIEQIEESFLAIENPEKRAEELSKIFRLMHSIKGAGGAVGLNELSVFAHKVEDVLQILRVKTDLVNSHVVSTLLQVVDAIKARIIVLRTGDRSPWDIEFLQGTMVQMAERLKAGQPWGESTGESAPTAMEPAPKVVASAPTEESTISKRVDSNKQFVKVDTEKIDQLMDAVGELVVIKSQLMNESAPYMESNAKLTSIITLFDRSIRDLQDKAMGMRLTPLKNTFLKLQRVVRDLSMKLNKPVDFHISGEETELDRNMVEALGDPLLHLVRNSLDHGIEPVSQRQASGKVAKGMIRLDAYVSGGRIKIEIKDDGGGINTEKVFKKAKEKGIVPADKNISDYMHEDILNFIFAPGFSTAEVVTDVSGRGVGMDVVKTNIERLRGTVDIESQAGKGTKFILSLPMTASITDGILVRVNNNPVIIPLNAVWEIIDFRGKTQLEVENRGKFLKLRDKMIPIVELSQMLKSFYNGAEVPEARVSDIMIVVELNGKNLALRVEEIVGQNQVVLKALANQTLSLPEIGGVAILGDGRVALVLDIAGLFQGHGERLREVSA